MKALAAILVIALLGASAPLSNLAPADKYFGRLKMSALRIRYEIAQLKSRYDNHKATPEDIEHLASFAEEAYYGWAQAFPKDTWLASTGTNLAKLYEELPGSDSRTRAMRALTFVRDRFKNTAYAKEAVAELNRGLPVRSYPQWAIALRPKPSPTPTPVASIAPSAVPSPAASPTAIPTRAPRGRFSIPL